MPIQWGKKLQDCFKLCFKSSDIHSVINIERCALKWLFVVILKKIADKSLKKKEAPNF